MNIGIKTFSLKCKDAFKYKFRMIFKISLMQIPTTQQPKTATVP